MAASGHPSTSIKYTSYRQDGVGIAILNGGFGALRPTRAGRKYSVTDGRFQEAGFHRPLCGDEFEEMTVASRP